MTLTRRSYAQVRQSAYHDPIGTAEYLLSIGSPLPLDLQDELEALGIMVDEFVRLHSEPPANPGFSIFTPSYHSPTLFD